jgi:hypothetical protein
MNNYYLIFTMQFPDGHIVSYNQYQSLISTMSHEDFETHQRIELGHDLDLIDDLQAIINE